MGTQKTSEEAYQYWYRRLIRAVKRRFPTLDPDEVATAVHDALCSFEQGALCRRENGQAVGLLFRIAICRARDALRKRKAQKRMLAQGNGLAVESISCNCADPACTAETHDLLHAIEACVARLPRRQRQAASLVLSSYCDLPRPLELKESFRLAYGEIITAKAASRLLDEIRRKLRPYRNLM